MQIARVLAGLLKSLGVKKQILLKEMKKNCVKTMRRHFERAERTKSELCLSSLKVVISIVLLVACPNVCGGSLNDLDDRNLIIFSF